MKSAAEKAKDIIDSGIDQAGRELLALRGQTVKELDDPQAMTVAGLLLDTTERALEAFRLQMEQSLQVLSTVAGAKREELAAIKEATEGKQLSMLKDKDIIGRCPTCKGLGVTMHDIGELGEIVNVRPHVKAATLKSKGKRKG